MYSDNNPSFSNIHDTETCRVCGQIAHGIHFQAVSCRACAAFFKRAILGKYQELKCQNENGRCVTSENGKFYCKRCRLERCIEAGMKKEKFQFNHDLIRTTDNFVISKRQKRLALNSIVPSSMATFLGRPQCVLSCDPELASIKKNYVDVRFMLDKAENIFNTRNVSNFKTNVMSGLSKMAFGLTEVRKSNHENIEVLTKLGKDESFYLCEEDLLVAASWLTYCEEFETLPHVAKVQILKCVWQLWIRLENIALTAEMRLAKKCPNDLMMAAKRIMLHCDQVDIDVSWCSNYAKEDIMFFLDPDQNTFLNEIVGEMIKLQPTAVEQTYMLAQICFQFAGKTFQGNILEATERIHEKISNDLHNYYINEMKMPNYSGRLTKLMKITNIIKKDLMKRLEKRELARLFDIFNVEFSHPEMFYKYCK